MEEKNILIVDDEPNAVKVLSSILSNEGYRVYNSLNVERAVNILDRHYLDAVITDMRMPERDGMHLFEYMRRNHPEIPVIFLTAYGTVESAVSTITEGAYYYFLKPPDYGKLKGVLSKAVEKRRCAAPAAICTEGPAEAGESIIGGTPEMRKIFETIRMVQDTSSSILITGETGTGKELIARSLHFQSRRAARPFVAVNCAAIPRELIESELFGYEKGAFTSAVARRIGRFEEAAGGTLFLDEIGEIELGLQAKLLRVLQEREIERLGSNRKLKVEFRLVASTNRDLQQETEAGRFRSDLIYRINVVQIKVPPLRERPGDIPLLADVFLREFCEREGKAVSLSGQVLDFLRGYSWPGNIRQLRNIMERAVVLARGPEVTVGDLPEEMLSDGAVPAVAGVAAGPEDTGQDNPQTLKEMEMRAVRNALGECRGNISKAAKLLGISRKTFYKRLKEA